MAAADDIATAALTLAEKASLLQGGDLWHTAAVPRAGIGAVLLSDGPHGLRRQASGAGDHVGIGRSEPATCYPTASALASSWNVGLVHDVGDALGREAREQGVQVVLGPGVNIKRSPLCGRNFEYFSEDPFLAGRLAAALIEGVQAHGVGTSIKHFAVNNQETDRVRVSADVDERTLREIYLPAFEHAVTVAQPWTVMCSYNRVNGVHASQDPWLLTDVLRGEWGFDGVVVSDWGAVHDRVAAVAAGLDLEMPPRPGDADAVVAAVRSGALDESVVDVAARRVLTLVERVGTPTELTEHEATCADCRRLHADPVAAGHDLARRAAAECAVLLKNEHGVLPLRPRAGQTVAVIGEFARTPRFQGSGSSQVNPTRVDVALDELRAGVPDGVDVAFAAGFTVAGGPDGDDLALAEEAVALAARADVVVAFCGLPAEDESEGWDRTHLRLPFAQTSLIARLAAANRRLVVVLANGSVVQVSDWDGHAAAILETWLSGQAAGGAVADLLLGVTSPSGRLAETIPLRLEDTTAFGNFPGEDGHVRYGEGVFVGYRGYDARRQDVSYPFGHGLTYASFDYSDLDVTVEGSVADDDLVVTVGYRVGNVLENSAQVAEVVQLYVGDPLSSVGRPPLELKGFDKIALYGGESTRQQFRLAARDFAFWSTRARRWLVEAGKFTIAVGASSRDLRLSTTIHLDAPPWYPPLDETATIREWLADPVGGPALLAAVGTDADGSPRGIAGDADALRFIGNFPIRAMTAFPGSGITPEVLAALQAR